MDLYVQGQYRAKRALAKAVYFHYLNLALAESGQAKSVPQHCMVLGPTGTGKTLLLKTLGAYLEVPVLFCNAASLSAEGYVGESVGDMLARLQSFCGNDSFKLSRAIVFLDEIDKLAISDESGDIRTGMVQQELLSVLDGNLLSREEKGTVTPPYRVDTSKLLIVASGAFAGIEVTAAKRLGTSGLGFSQKSKSSQGASYSEVTSDDLMKYGLMPEFVARFPHLIPLEKLTKDEYSAIFDSPTQSPFSPYDKLFRVHGVKLKVLPEARAKLAEQAAGAAEGARGLRRRAGKILESVDWQLADLADSGCTEITVTMSCVEGGAPPELSYKEVKAKSQAEELRQSVFNSDAVSKLASKKRLQELKEEIGWRRTEGSARKWWSTFETENESRLGLVEKLAQELRERKATISEFFLAYVYSNTDNIQANLHYLDYWRIKEALHGKASLCLHITNSPICESAEDLNQLREEVGYSRADSFSRLIYDCLEHSLGRRAGALGEFVVELKEKERLSLSEFSLGVVLTQVLEPKGVFYYLKYKAAGFGGLDVEKELASVFGSGSSNLDRKNSQTLEFLQREARLQLVRRIRVVYPSVVSRYLYDEVVGSYLAIESTTP